MTEIKRVFGTDSISPPSPLLTHSCSHLCWFPVAHPEHEDGLLDPHIYPHLCPSLHILHPWYSWVKCLSLPLHINPVVLMDLSFGQSQTVLSSLLDAEPRDVRLTRSRPFVRIDIRKTSPLVTVGFNEYTLFYFILSLSLSLSLSFLTTFFTAVIPLCVPVRVLTD